MKPLALPNKTILAPGPARLLENLDGVFKSHDLPPAACVFIDREQQVSAIHTADAAEFADDVADAIDQLDEPSGIRVVLLRRINTRLPSEQERSECESWARRLSDCMSVVVDILLVGPDFWWSTLCHDEGCCPPFGRPRNAKATQLTPRQRRHLWKCLRAYARVEDMGFEPSEDDIANMIFWLADIRLRDSVLAHAGQNKELRNKWLAAVQQLRAHPTFADETPLGSIECSLHYLAGDLRQARAVAQQVLKQDGSYSLAVLLHKGLLNNAPPDLLEAAFCNTSIDFLMGKEESDGPEQAA